MMNSRERFLRIMDYKKVDKLPLLAVEPYEKTAISRWIDEGLLVDKTIEEAIGMDKFMKVPINLAPNPRFEHKVLFEDSKTIIETDTIYGATVTRDSKGQYSVNFNGSLKH